MGDSVLASDLEYTDLLHLSLNACPPCIHSLSISASNLHNIVNRPLLVMDYII